MIKQNEDWRKFLKDIISSYDLLQKLADEMNVNTTTLARWMMKHDITPHNSNLERLFRAPSFPPEHKSQMELLLQKEFPDFQAPQNLIIEPVQQAITPIPGEFYYRALKAATTTAENVKFSVVTQLVLQQITSHLSVYAPKTGLFLLTPPCCDSVRSLYMPTQPSGVRLASLRKTFPIFAGIESAMHTVLNFSSMIFDSVHELPMPSYLPELQAVKSTLALPLHRGDRVGGCCLIACNTFFTAEEEVILSGYSYLLSLALREQDFYPPEQLKLGLFPGLGEQLELETRTPFYDRVKRISHQYPQLSLEQLQRSALQELEQYLIEFMKEK